MTCYDVTKILSDGDLFDATVKNANARLANCPEFGADVAHDLLPIVTALKPCRLPLCATDRVRLKADLVYLFFVEEGCPACARMAAAAE